MPYLELAPHGLLVVLERRSAAATSALLLGGQCLQLSAADACWSWSSALTLRETVSPSRACVFCWSMCFGQYHGWAVVWSVSCIMYDGSTGWLDCGS